MESRVFIHAIGAVTAAGVGRERLVDARPAFADGAAEFPGAPPGILAAKAVDLPLQARFPHLKTYLDRCSALSLVAAKAAFDEAGWTVEKPPSLDAGLALATDFACLDTLDRYVKKVKEAGFKLAPPFLFTHAYPNAPNSLVAIELGLGGYNLNLAGEHGGIAAIAAAATALRRGRVRRILAGGAEALGAARLSYEAGRGTPVAGEAAVFLALSLDEAAPRIGAILSTGQSGRSPGSAAAEEAVAKALAKAGLCAADVGFAVAGSASRESFADGEGPALAAGLGPAAPVLLPGLAFGSCAAAKGPLAIALGLEILRGAPPPDAMRADPARAAPPAPSKPFVALTLDPGGAAAAAVVAG